MLKNWFENFDEWINDTEGSLVNALTAFAPWLAPLAPAYMTYRHMVDFLNFPNVLALALAMLVEILGFGTVSTFLDFWFHNKKERAKVKQAPLGIVVFSFGFYLCLIVISNVVIDIAKAFGTSNQEQWAIILVRLLLTLQTIPGALIVAVRTGHRDLLKQIKIDKKDAESKPKLSESAPHSGEELSETFRNFPKDLRSLEPTLTYEQKIEIANLTPADVKEWAYRVGVTEKTITNWRTYFKNQTQ